MCAEIVFYRWAFAAAMLTPMLLRPTLRSWPVIKAHPGKVFVLGLLALAVYQSLAYFAAPNISATNMGIVLALMPLILAVFAMGHRLTIGAVAGSLLSFIGVLIVITSGDLTSLAKQGIGGGDATAIRTGFGGRGGLASIVCVVTENWIERRQPATDTFRLCVCLYCCAVGLDDRNQTPGPQPYYRVF